jgi:hypothetical protein
LEITSHAAASTRWELPSRAFLLRDGRLTALSLRSRRYLFGYFWETFSYFISFFSDVKNNNKNNWNLKFLKLCDVGNPAPWFVANESLKTIEPADEA